MHDSISWNFLEAILFYIGFDTKFIGWIMQCVTTISHSISINGGTYGHFQDRCGLQQEDPLFPLLFIICLEYLYRLLKTSTLHSDFNFHP